MEPSKATQQDPPASQKPVGKKTKNLRIPIFNIILVLLIIAGFAGSVLYTNNKVSEVESTQKANEQKLSDGNKKVEEFIKEREYPAPEVDEDTYQAVFLQGGQVYFGKITKFNETSVTLENIYYLRAGEYSQGGTVSSDASLVKLGKELHGPEDVMYIERKNMSFWENLKTDGEVVKAIQDYEVSGQ